MAKVFRVGCVDDGDMVMDGQAALRLPGRPDPSHDFLTSSGQPVASLDLVLVGPCGRDRFCIAAQLVRYDHLRQAELSDQTVQKGLRGFDIATISRGKRKPFRCGIDDGIFMP